MLNATRRSELSPDSAIGEGGDYGSRAVWAFVKVTTAGSAGTGWPGVVLFPLNNSTFDPDASSELALIYTADILIPLVVGQVYIARLSGWDDSSARSTWQAKPDCCSAPVSGDPGPVPPPRCYSCINAPACLELLVDDGFGWSGKVYASLVNSDNGACIYTGSAITPNAQLTYDVTIGQSAGVFPNGGSLVQINSQSLISFIDGGLSRYGQPCPVSWDGNGFFPMGQHLGSQGIHPPAVASIQAASDPALCSGSSGAGGTGGDPGSGAGGTTSQQQCFTFCSAACTDAYGAGTSGEFYCINNCAVGCFGPGGLLGIRSAGGCSNGDCGCSGTCGTTSPSSLAPAAQYWSLVDYSTTLATATVKPLYQRTDAVGNVGVGEDTLYTNNIAANTLSLNGDSVQIDLTYLIAASQSGRPRLYFGGVKVYDHGGSVTAGLTDLAKAVRVIVTRVSSSTAIATAYPTGSDGQFTSTATLTGLNFGAAIEIKATGDATNNNDIKCVQAVVVKLPAAETLTQAGVQTMPTVLSYGPASQCAPAQDAAGYTGASATQLQTGSASGAMDVDVFIVPSVSVTAGQIIRVFKEIGGTKVAVMQKALLPRTSLASDPTWQTPEYICTVRLNGTSEKIFVSKEVNEAMLARGEPRNYFA